MCCKLRVVYIFKYKKYIQHVYKKTRNTCSENGIKTFFIYKNFN